MKKKLALLIAFVLLTTPVFADDLTIAYGDKTLSIEYFREDKLERYIGHWHKKPQLHLKDVILEVNMDLDKPFYFEPNDVDINAFPMLVNKYNILPRGFIPDNLILAEGENYLTQDAADAYRLMLEELEIGIYISSSYRSYDVQKRLHASYGAGADKFSARPGHSEHQLGTAIDLRLQKDLGKNMSLSQQHFELSEEYELLCQKAYLYGFILRYPKGKEYITGYIYEPWHWTYVGIPVATECHNRNITLEEYYAMQ